MKTIYLKFFFIYSLIRPNKKISVFRVTGLNILGREGTHIFLNYFFSGKKYIFMHWEWHFTFQNAYHCIFSRKPEKCFRFHQ